MKKIICTLLLCFAMGVVFAQSVFQSNRYGVKAGANISTANLDIPLATKSLLAYHIGGFVNIGLGGKFALQPELLFSAQGYKQDYSDRDIPIEAAKLSWNYVNLPVLVQYAVTEKLHVEAGPQFGVLVTAKYQEIYEEDADFGRNVEFGTSPNSTPPLGGGGQAFAAFTAASNRSESIDIKDGQRGFDFGMAIGVGYLFTPHIGANVRYSHGFLNVNEQAAFKAKNRVFSVGVCYIF